MTVSVYFTLITFVGTVAASGFLAVCGERGAGFRDFERAGCLCKFRDGTQKCVIRTRANDGPFLDMFYHEKSHEVRARSFPNMNSIGGCYFGNSELRMTGYFDCEGGDLVGICNPGENERCCNSEERCTSCKDVQQCDPGANTTSLTTTTTTTTTKKSSATSVVSEIVTDSLPLSSDSVTLTTSFIGNNSENLSSDMDATIDVGGDGGDIGLLALLCIALGPALCVAVSMGMIMYCKCKDTSAKKETLTIEEAFQNCDFDNKKGLSSAKTENSAHFPSNSDRYNTMPALAPGAVQDWNYQQISTDRPPKTYHDTPTPGMLNGNHYVAQL